MQPEQKALKVCFFNQRTKKKQMFHEGLWIGTSVGEVVPSDISLGVICQENMLRIERVNIIADNLARLAQIPLTTSRLL